MNALTTIALLTLVAIAHQNRTTRSIKTGVSGEWEISGNDSYFLFHKNGTIKPILVTYFTGEQDDEKSLKKIHKIVKKHGKGLIQVMVVDPSGLMADGEGLEATGGNIEPGSAGIVATIRHESKAENGDLDFFSDTSSIFWKEFDCKGFKIALKKAVCRIDKDSGNSTEDKKSKYHLEKCWMDGSGSAGMGDSS